MYSQSALVSSLLLHAVSGSEVIEYRAKVLVVNSASVADVVVNSEAKVKQEQGRSRKQSKCKSKSKNQRRRASDLLT
jgi:hypothetical protein